MKQTHSSSPQTVLTNPARAESLYALAQAGVLSPEELDVALLQLGRLPDKAAWRHFIERLLLGLGGLLVLAGIIFFFAYNWAELHKFYKFTLLELSLLGAALLAARQGYHSAAGQLSLFIAAFLVGALLAVYGQIYQTGADAYSLFFSWLLLILPWTLIGRSLLLWLLCWALANLSLYLYWEQIIAARYTVLWLILAGLNSMLWAAWEMARGRWRWLQQAWLRPLLLSAALLPLALPTWNWIVDWPHDSLSALKSLAVLFYFLGTLFSIWYSQILCRDLASLALVLTGVVATLTLIAARFLLDTMPFSWFLLGLLLIIQASIASRWLLYLQAAWKQEKNTL